MFFRALYDNLLNPPQTEALTAAAMPRVTVVIGASTEKVATEMETVATGVTTEKVVTGSDEVATRKFLSDCTDRRSTQTRLPHPIRGILAPLCFHRCSLAFL